MWKLFIFIGETLNFLETLWAFTLVAAPYLMLGLFLSGLIKNFVDIEYIKKLMGGKGVKNIFSAAFFGIPLPLCSCAVIPTAVTLKKNGASNGATSSFLISTPESGVDSIAMTYGMMDLPMTIIRPVAAFMSAITAGLLQHFFNKEEYEVVEEKKSCCKSKMNGAKSDEKLSFFKKLVNSVKFGYLELLEDMAFWLFLGIFTGALIEFLLPANAFEYLNGTGGRFLILLVGVPMYICASATTPIAASLVLKGMSPGTSLLILLVGPATNLSNILVLQKYIGKKGVIINIFAIVVVALGFSYLIDFLYSYYNWSIDFKMQMHKHGEENSMMPLIWGVIFTLLLARALLIKLKAKFIK